MAESLASFRLTALFHSFLKPARAHTSTRSGGKAHLLACALSWLDVKQLQFRGDVGAKGLRLI